MTAWAQGGLKDAYVIGGYSKSMSFLETKEDRCEKEGCAFVTVWFQIQEKFKARWAFKDFDSVLNINTHESSKRSAVIFLRKPDDEKADGKSISFGFVYYESSTTILFHDVGYSVNDALHIDGITEFANLVYMNSDKLSFIVNDPNRLKISEYFFEIDDSADWSSNSEDTVISGAYSEQFTTANSQNVLFGSPTRKTMQRKGYDENNVIQFATLTFARGEKEFGQPDTLGRATTYQVVVSRKYGTEASPFSLYDRMYGWEQDSPTSFY